MADITSPPVDPSSVVTPASSSPLRRFLRAISSPWVSLFLLIIVFVHQAIGSAFYKIRQSFEVNEMEWFNGPESMVLWGLICFCLITASIVRVPWTWRKAGTLMSHAGVVLMVITCTIYFTYKKEGDALLVRHYIKVDSALGSCRLLPNAGYSAPLGNGTAKVSSVMPRWTILSHEGKSQQAWAVMVEITLPDAEAFTATLIENRPDLTQYTLTGRRPNTYMPEFTGVVANDGKVHALDIDGKPILNAELQVGAEVSEKVTGGERSLKIDKVTPDFPLLAEGFQGRTGTMLEWTLKSPAGQQNGSSVVGEPSLTRYQRARVKSAPDKRLSAIVLEHAPEVMAYNKDIPAIWVRREDAARFRDPMVPMRGVGPDAVAALPIKGLPRYHDYGRHMTNGKALAINIGSVNGVDFHITGFSPYARLTSRWKEDKDAVPNPILDVRFTSSVDGQGFNRVVSATTDIGSLVDTPLLWLHCVDEPTYQQALAQLQQQFPVLEKESTDDADQELAAKTRLAFISAPGKKVTLHVGQPGRNLRLFPMDQASEVTVALWGDNVTVRLNQILQRPSKVSEPVPVPKEQQQSRMSVGDFESLVEVTAMHQGKTTSMWVPYSPYPHLPREMGDETSLGMYAPRPIMIDVPGSGRYELMYSKAPMEMPGSIWMTGFDVPRRPGSDEPSEFFCFVGYGDEKAPQTAKIHMNYPLEWKDTFFFQASWDPQGQALTVLGVGNRPAGYPMLWASIVLALGIAWSGFAAAFTRSAGSSASTGRKP